MPNQVNINANIIKVSIFSQMKIALFILIVFSLLPKTTYQEAPLSETLISNISLTLTSNTYLRSSSLYYVCSAQILNVYNLLTGAFAYSVSFNSIATGSILECFDVMEDDSYCLFNKGTTIIRFKGGTQTYDYYDNFAIKTEGRLLLDGSMSVTNYPSTGKLYILDHTSNASVLLTPNASVTTANYSISVNSTRSIFSVFQNRRIFSYQYTGSTWNMLTSISLSPPIGSNVYFLSYSPSGNLVYHSKGTSTINIRHSNNLTLITSIAYTGLNVVNVEFMNSIGDQIYILFWNSTSGLYSGQIYNTTSSTVEQNITLTTAFLSLKIYPDSSTKVITYSTYVQVWKMSCPVDSIYVTQYGNCQYCNQTNLCPTNPFNSSNITNQTNSTDQNNSTNQTYTINQTNTTDINNMTNMTNTTQGSNLTNSTSGDGNLTNLTNSTNSTSSDGNLTNLTNSTNSTSNNSSSINSTSIDGNLTNSTNMTNSTNDNTTDYFAVPQATEMFTSLEQTIIDITAKFYSFPALRSSFKSFSYAFLAMDSLWMYYYHNRTYGSKTVQVFAAIQRVQNLKFAFLTVIQALYQILTSTQFVIKNISDYSSYTASDFYKIQQNDGTFLANCLDYLIYQIPFTIITFYIIRKIFFRLFNYQISKYIRLYAFWGYCLVSVLEPNIQYFFFLLANEFKLTFLFSYKTKFLNVIWISILFFAVLLSIILVFTIKYLHAKKVGLFMEGVFNKNMGLFWICFNTSIKRMCTGFVHSYFVTEPFSQIIYLISIQCASVVITFIFWKRVKIFKSSLFVCMNITFSLVIICFQCVLIINSLVVGTDELVLEMMDQVLFISVLSILSTGLFFGIINLTPFETCKTENQDDQEQLNKKKTYKITCQRVQGVSKITKSCYNFKNIGSSTKQGKTSGDQVEKVKSSMVLFSKKPQLSIVLQQENALQKNDGYNVAPQIQMIRNSGQRPKIAIANIKNLNLNNFRKQKKMVSLANGRKVKTYKTKMIEQKANQTKERKAKSSVQIDGQVLQKSLQKVSPAKKTLKSIRFIEQTEETPNFCLQLSNNIFNFNTEKSIKPSQYKIKSSKRIKEGTLILTQKQIRSQKSTNQFQV